MTIKQYDTNGKAQADVTVSDDIFAHPISKAIMSQYVHVHRKRSAVGTRKTKGRGEVSGGGRKPWRQKGTGRARAGSTRSPLWVGGGHTHAIVPTDNARTNMSRKMRKVALLSSLSWSAKHKNVQTVSAFNLETPQTKVINSFLREVELLGKRVLFVSAELDKNLVKSVSNIKRADVIEVRQLNAYDILSHSAVIFVGDAYQKIEL